MPLFDEGLCAVLCCADDNEARGNEGTAKDDVQPLFKTSANGCRWLMIAALVDQPAQLNDHGRSAPNENRRVAALKFHSESHNILII